MTPTNLPRSELPRPLDRFGSLKIKLGILVAASVTAAAVLATTGAVLGWWPGFTIPVTVLVALALTQLLARGMTSPLREMTAAARLMARGDYSTRVTATSTDEVGDLARAFNSMSAELAAVEQQRRDLVANVSHELRTPTAALQAVLENLVDGVSAPDDETLRTALHQTERLSRLVRDLLDLSRVDAGITALSPAPVELEPLLRTAAAEAALGGRPVTFEVLTEPPELIMIADRDRLLQLLVNLADNAARHARPHGTVRLQARRSSADAHAAAHLAAVDHAVEQGVVVIDVIDDGPGIPVSEREAVFERFTTSRAAGGGTGLGLAIARWVTQLHGGTIHVADSTGGCDIRITLPAPGRTVVEGS